MDLLTATIIACSLHPDEALVRALVQGQSQGAQYFVGDLTELKSVSSAQNAADAQTLLLAVESKGHRAALGYLGLPTAWAAAFGRGTSDLWNACVNISVGTAKLSEFDYQCRKHARRRGASGPLSRRACIVRHFAEELELPPVQQSLFVSGILNNVRDMSKRPSSVLPPAQPPRAGDPSADWSADFFFSPLPPFQSQPGQ